MKRKLNGLTISGMTLLLVSIGNLAGMMLENPVNRWTPSTSPLSISDVNDRVEIIINGKPLREHLAAGTLLITDGGRGKILKETDIGVRLNNWDRVHVGILKQSIYFWVSATAGLMLLIFGMFVPLRRREEEGEKGKSRSL